jgi:hypothetical protein
MTKGRAGSVNFYPKVDSPSEVNWWRYNRGVGQIFLLPIKSKSRLKQDSRTFNWPILAEVLYMTIETLIDLLKFARAVTGFIRGCIDLIPVLKRLLAEWRHVPRHIVGNGDLTSGPSTIQGIG